VFSFNQIPPGFSNPSSTGQSESNEERKRLDEWSR
jgi:hypothetical protein